MKHNPCIMLDTKMDASIMHADLLYHGYYVDSYLIISNSIPNEVHGRVYRSGDQIIMEERCNDYECLQTVYERRESNEV